MSKTTLERTDYLFRHICVVVRDPSSCCSLPVELKVKPCYVLDVFCLPAILEHQLPRLNVLNIPNDKQ